MMLSHPGRGHSMADDNHAQQMADTAAEAELLRRRDYLKSLKKWSQAVIGGVILGALVPGSKAAAGGSIAVAAGSMATAVVVAVGSIAAAGNWLRTDDNAVPHLRIYV